MKISPTNSPDLLHGEIQQLAQIFPQFVSEGKVDIGGLQSYIEQETITGERYNLNRYGKSQAKLIAREPSIANLIPDVEKSIHFDTSKNLLIEGDNLEVIKLLQSSYQKEVKVIYIDPPYNKDKDFVYSDTRKDSLGNYMRITGQII
jgi:adenine-specific DNA-methyltransferase